MNEIKFRAWDKVNKKMCRVLEIYFSGIDANEVLIQHPDNFEELLLGVDTQATLLQYTGLLDKNGKEIWEGDIIDVWYPDVKSPHHISPVIYRENAMCFDTEWVDDFVRAECVVIGNIYEDSRLLGDKT